LLNKRATCWLVCKNKSMGNSHPSQPLCSASRHKQSQLHTIAAAACITCTSLMLSPTRMRRTLERSCGGECVRATSSDGQHAFYIFADFAIVIHVV
jgi:hypothetical protein